MSRSSPDTRTLDSNHRTIKSLIKPVLGFQSMCAKRGVPKTAYTTSKGSNGMPMAENGQLSLWIGVASGRTKVSFGSGLFGVYA